MLIDIDKKKIDFECKITQLSRKYKSIFSMLNRTSKHKNRGLKKID